MPTASQPTSDQSTVPSVPLGLTSKTGYSVSAAGFVLALIAFLSGDRSDPTVETIAIAVVTAASYLVTQIGRYLQARELASRVAPPPVTVRICPCGPASGNSDNPGDVHAMIAAIGRALQPSS